jgi:hypothetical protein
MDALGLSCGFFFASFFAFLRDSFTFFLIFARWLVDTRLEVSATCQVNIQRVVACVFRVFPRTLSYADHGFGSTQRKWLGQREITDDLSSWRTMRCTCIMQLIQVTTLPEPVFAHIMVAGYDVWSDCEVRE